MLTEVIRLLELSFAHGIKDPKDWTKLAWLKIKPGDPDARAQAARIPGIDRNDYASVNVNTGRIRTAAYVPDPLALAHEIGHYMLGNAQSGDLIQRERDAWAYALTTMRKAGVRPSSGQMDLLRRCLASYVRNYFDTHKAAIALKQFERQWINALGNPNRDA